MTLKKSRASRLFILMAAASCGLAPLAALPALPAYAGPDDGKVVTTRTHVDSPKTYFRDGTFRLVNEHPSYDGQCSGPRVDIEDGMCLDPLDDTVVYVGKGWSGNGTNTQQYQFQVPDTPSLKELGAPGDTWYLAPALPEGNRDPNWVGFGSDLSIPTEKLRDGTYELEILHVNGPGRVEMFNYPTFEYPNDVSRLLSSSNPTYRSIPLLPGSHTHNQTVFERPGRYEITYRTVARGTDGSIIASEPSTQVWQVGGARPGPTPTPSTKQRYDAARAGEIGGLGYTLSTTPKKDPSKDGDDNLTTITFDAGDPALGGTVTLFINGFFLTDLPVKNGIATWDELLGSAESDIQAVFTPSGESGARWISPALHHSDGESASVWSVWDGSGQWPTPQPEEENTQLSTENYTPKDTGFTVTVGATSNPQVGRVSIEFDDPKIRGYLSGGLFEGESASGNALVRFNEGVANGRGEDFVSYLSYFDGTGITVDFLPHPNMNMRGFTFTLPAKFQRGEKMSQSGHFTVGEGGPSSLQVITADGTPEPTPAKPGAPAPHEPGAPGTPDAPAGEGDSKVCMDSSVASRIMLTHGHADIQASLNDGHLGIALKDETGVASKKSVERSLEDVAFAIPNHTRHSREGAALMDKNLDFLGPEGSTFYLLPQAQLQGTVWPGYNTQLVDYEKLNGGVQLHLDPVSMPESGAVGVYSQNLGKNTVLLDSSANDSVIDVDFATHAHANWAFTRPGIYELDAYYSATSADGTALESEHNTLVFAVGDEALEKCASTPGKESASGEESQGGDKGAPSGKGSPVDGGKPDGGTPGEGMNAGDPAGERDSGTAVETTPSAGENTATHATTRTQGVSAHLPRTGAEIAGALGLAGVLLGVGGGALAVVRRRTHRL